MKKLIFAFVILVVLVLTVTYRYVLPFVGSGEYWIETYEFGKMVHVDDCPRKSSWSRWFTVKEPLYDILLKRDMRLCGDCFDELNKQKVEALNFFNKQELAKRIPDSLRVEYMSKYK